LVKVGLSACLPLLATLSGCGLTNHMYSVAWTATLDQPPDARCIESALTPLPDVFRADLKDRPGGYVVGVHLKPRRQSNDEVRESKARLEAQLKREGIRNYRDWPDITIVVAPTKRGNFSMGYMGWPKASDPREVAAQEIIQKLADACIPGLSARVKENRDSEWLPYMFNI
jgi:hypothetical protein